jgi:hypothetical protein
VYEGESLVGGERRLTAVGDGQMDSLVDSVPLVLNTPAVQHVSVNLYVDDKGTAKGLPVNARASAIVQACGKMLEVRGDAFIGRVFDNGALWLSLPLLFPRPFIHSLISCTRRTING